MEEIRLPDLETIRRFSVAIRQEFAPAEEVVEALRADLDQIERELGLRGSRSRAPAEVPARDEAPARKAAARSGRTPPRRKPPARKTPAKRGAKAASKRGGRR